MHPYNDLTMSKSELNKLIALNNTTVIELIKIVNAIIGDGSPKGVFPTVFALKSKYPNGAKGIYVVSENGHWYYWNGQWSDGGVYQSDGLANGSVGYPILDQFLKDQIDKIDNLQADNIAYRGLVPSARDVQQALDATYKRVDTIIASSGTSSTEVVDARGGFPVLGDRLNNSDLKVNNLVKRTESIINVKSFGAKGDGVNDDSQAFLDAIAYAKINPGKYVYAPTGVYFINTSSKLVVDFDGFQIAGDGMDQTVIRFNKPTGGFELRKTSGNLYKFRMSDIQFNGNNLCNTLITSMCPLSEIVFENFALRSATDAAFSSNFNLSLTWFSNGDITNTPYGFKTASLAGVWFDSINFYLIQYVFYPNDISSLTIDKCWVEDCGNFILTPTTSTTGNSSVFINDTIFNVMGYKGTPYVPFVFQNDVAIGITGGFYISNSKFIFSSDTKFMFEFTVKRTRQAYVNLTNVIIQRSSSSFFESVIKPTTDTAKNFTILTIIGGNTPLNDYDAFIVGSNGYINALLIPPSGINLQTGTRGLKLTSATANSGRVTYNTTTNRLAVTNNSDQPVPIPLTLAASTANRGTLALQVGEFYWDVTLNKPIWFRGSGIYVDANGTSV